MCGLSIQEATLSVNRDLEKDTWRGRPQGGMPDHFAALAKHVDGSVVLLRSNGLSIVTSRFGINSALTSAAVWVPGREDPPHYHDCGDMEESATGRRWWLLPRRNEMVLKEVVISGVQSLTICCR